MKTYIITYDLNKEGQNYQWLINKIQEYKYIHPMKSVFFIKSNSTSTEINNILLDYIDTNDRLFISEVTSNRNWLLTQDDWNFISN